MDNRCKAGIDVDGSPLGSVIVEGLPRPFMFLLSDHSSEPDREKRPVLANIRSIYDRLPSESRLYIVIRGANHYGFGDGATLKSPLLMSVLHRLGVIQLEGLRQLAVTRHYVSTFFDVNLKGAPGSELGGRSDYPEVEYIH